ncbi:dipeptidase [Sphingomonas sp. URHD0057]|uniref:dipeptidase n=1 Tax=Sphingomonas sp. URHD0057 TaxID=1380389 RepID=UPI00056A7750|nr:dipeptidase [Sphingomonas sp. URHD0057]
MRKLTRRRVLQGALAASAFPMINRGSFAFAAAPGRTYSARAIKVVHDSLVIDMLAPLKLDFDPKFFDQPFGPKDIAEFKASGITGFHHSIGIGAPGAKTQALDFLASYQGWVGRQADYFTLVGTAADIDHAKAEGKYAIIMGLQNADQFETAEDVKYFYRLGLRCAQLTYNSQNLIGSGSTDRIDGGVSDFGQEIITAMNKTGMLIDTSHSGERTTLDAIALSAKPIAVTHSNCKALNPHPRNKSDEVIQKLAAKGGVMGITGVRMFIKATDPTTVSDMADHVDHVAKLVGIEHVGIGSDADLNGYDDMPPDQYKQLKAGYKASYAFRDKIDIDGFDHPQKIFDLTEQLIRRGYSDDNIRLVLGGNFRRLLGATWS